MTDILGLVQQGLFFGFIIALTVAGLSHLLYPALLPKIKQLSPDLQSRLVFTWAALPVISAFLIVFVAILPSLLQILGLSNDHCLGHPEGHIHFCLIHRHAAVNNLQTWLPAILFLLLLVSMLLALLVDIVGIARFRRSIEEYSYTEEDDNIGILDTETPLALTCGLFRQKIFLSTGLLSYLTVTERNIIVSHERLHLRRQDVWKKLLARSLSLAHVPKTRNLLLEHLNLSCEQVCDSGSVKNAEERIRVAELLLRVEGLYKQHFTVSNPLASAVYDRDSHALAERIYSLLHHQEHPHLGGTFLFALVTSSVSLLVGHDFIHDALEDFMFMIAGL